MKKIMECKACKREKLKKENPDKEFMTNALVHTCKLPEYVKKEEICDCGRTIFKYGCGRLRCQCKD